MTVHNGEQISRLLAESEQQLAALISSGRDNKAAVAELLHALKETGTWKGRSIPDTRYAPGDTKRTFIPRFGQFSDWLRWFLSDGYMAMAETQTSISPATALKWIRWYGTFCLVCGLDAGVVFGMPDGVPRMVERVVKFEPMSREVIGFHNDINRDQLPAVSSSDDTVIANVLIQEVFETDNVPQVIAWLKAILDEDKTVLVEDEFESNDHHIVIVARTWHPHQDKPAYQEYGGIEIELDPSLPWEVVELIRKKLGLINEDDWEKKYSELEQIAEQ